MGENVKIRNRNTNVYWFSFTGSDGFDNFAGEFCTRYLLIFWEKIYTKWLRPWIFPFFLAKMSRLLKKTSPLQHCTGGVTFDRKYLRLIFLFRHGTKKNIFENLWYETGRYAATFKSRRSKKQFRGCSRSSGISRALVGLLNWNVRRSIALKMTYQKSFETLSIRWSVGPLEIPKNGAGRKPFFRSICGPNASSDRHGLKTQNIKIWWDLSIGLNFSQIHWKVCELPPSGDS